MEPETQVGGTVLGRFRIERVLGRGGMATVFAAFDEKHRKSVALKLLKKELTRDPMVVRRFEREAKAASHLRHPNVIEIIEWGVEGEEAFISMELANGIDLLRALSQERPMRQSRAVLILGQVCAALTAAHAKGIVHRDLKPENILLVHEPEELGKERAKVLDFGIAKILDLGKGGPGSEDPPSYVTKTALTRVGTIVGTPAYMSPEQCRGGDIDGRSDIYACGVLLYQLVTGELPFSGETPLHTAMRHIHAQPRNPGELRRGLSPAIERTILKALAKWPGERQQTAEQLREELHAAFPGLPDRGDLVLPATKSEKPSSPPARTDAGRISEEARAHAITTGGLGSTPLRGVRLNRAAEPTPTEKTIPNRPETERDPSRAKDPRTEDADDDEPRTFLIKPNGLDAVEARLSTAPQTVVPDTAVPDTAIPSTDKLTPSAKPSSGGVKAPSAAPPAPRPGTSAAKSTARGAAAGKPEAERRVAPTAVSTTPRAKAQSGPPAATPRPQAVASRAPETTNPVHTETGLTPTALQPLPKSPPPSEVTSTDNAKTERGNAAPVETDRFPGVAGPEVDDDEPATFIRDVGPGSAPHVKTLVMDEPRAPQPGPQVQQGRVPQGQAAQPAVAQPAVAQPAAAQPSPQAQVRQAPSPTRDPATNYAGAAAHQSVALAPTVAQPPTGAPQPRASQAAGSIHPPAAHGVQPHPAQQPQSWDPTRSTGFAGNGHPVPQQAPQAQAQQQAQPSPQPQQAPQPQQGPGVAGYHASFAAMSNTARMAEDASEPQVKATVRMNPQETVAKAGGAALPSIASGWNESTVARRRAPKRSGLIGQIDALSGSTGMLIGIGLGLALAAVGLLIAVLALD